MEKCVRAAIEAASRKLGSQGRLAEALGVHSNTISGWKNGSRDPGTKMLVRIFSLADLSMDKMFDLLSAPASRAVTAEDLAPLIADVAQLKQGQALLLAALQSVLASLLAGSSSPPKVQDSAETTLAALTSPPALDDNRTRMADSAMRAVAELKGRLPAQAEKSVPAPREAPEVPERKVSGE